MLVAQRARPRPVAGDPNYLGFSSQVTFRCDVPAGPTISGSAPFSDEPTEFRVSRDGLRRNLRALRCLSFFLDPTDDTSTYVGAIDRPFRAVALRCSACALPLPSLGRFARTDDACQLSSSATPPNSSLAAAFEGSCRARPVESTSARSAVRFTGTQLLGTL